MLLKNKLDKFKTLLKEDNVLANLEERYCYAKDASNNNKDYKIPDLVVFVETIEDVQKVMKYAFEHDIPVIPRGAGTNMVGACVTTNGGIVLNFSRMNKILEVNQTNMTARVQPGVVLGDLKTEVETLGLFYPPDPSNYKVSTIGGSIAQSSGGARSFKYGTTKDYVLSLKVVTSSGELLTIGSETTKNVVGYNLIQLFVGSEGTLGVVVEATLKLIPIPEQSLTVVSYFDDVKDAIIAIEKIQREHIFPAAVDFMDKNSLKTVEDFLQCGLRIDSECLILIELDGSFEAVNEQVKKVCSIVKESGALENFYISTNDTNENIWRARRASYAAATRLAPDVLSDDIIVPRSALIEMINKCKEVSEKYFLKICLVGHIGDGNLHPQFVLNLDNENEYRSYISAKSELYSYAVLLGGTISAEHGIGLEKLDFLEHTIDSGVLAYMKMLKKMFDAKNILNPGKIFKNL